MGKQNIFHEEGYYYAFRRMGPKGPGPVIFRIEVSYEGFVTVEFRGSGRRRLGHVKDRWSKWPLSSEEVFEAIEDRLSSKEKELMRLLIP